MSIRFRRELIALCLLKKTNLKTLAKELSVEPTWLSTTGSKKGIAYEQLCEILKILKATHEEGWHLKSLAKYTKPREPFAIDDEFLCAVEYLLMENKKYWNDHAEVCKAVLSFVGVKTKIK